MAVQTISKAIGIDLGCTNSVVAVMNPSNTDIIVHQDRIARRETTPSCVWKDPKSGEILVGHRAYRLIGTIPSPIRSIKRTIGKQTTILLTDEEKTPEEISALILGDMKRQIEGDVAKFNTDDTTWIVDRAVIAVPAYFDQSQIEATRKAGEMAGLEVLDLLHEPTAAACYHCWKSGIQDGVFLVYDLGGGTFDVSVLRSQAGAFEVLGISGDNLLGGDDFDRVLAENLQERLLSEGYALELDPQHELCFDQLKFLAESVKIALSSAGEYLLRDTATLKDKVGNPVIIDTMYERPEFEELIRPLVKRTLSYCFEALERAQESSGITLADVDAIILAGGSTHIPLVREMVQRALCADPAVSESRAKCTEPVYDKVDTIVALGAAIRAAAVGGLSVYNPEHTIRVSVREADDLDTKQTRLEGKVKKVGTDLDLSGGRIRLKLPEFDYQDEVELAENGNFSFSKVPLQSIVRDLLNFEIFDRDETSIAKITFDNISQKEEPLTPIQPSKQFFDDLVRDCYDINQQMKGIATKYEYSHEFEEIAKKIEDLRVQGETAYLNGEQESYSNAILKLEEIRDQLRGIIRKKSDSSLTERVLSSKQRMENIETDEVFVSSLLLKSEEIKQALQDINQWNLKTESSSVDLYLQLSLSGLPDDLAYEIRKHAQLQSPKEKLSGGFKLPEKIGPFKIIRELGRGAFTVVCLALDTTSWIKRQVALKIPTRQRLDEQWINRIRHEAKIWRLLSESRHPNILQLEDLKQILPFTFFVTEYMDGGNLAAALRNYSNSQKISVVTLALLQISKGLAFAHQQEVVHGDIKPQNILVSSDLTKIKLGDFGLSFLSEKAGINDLHNSKIAGTLMFLAPESLDGTMNQQSDIYALGVTLYYLLTNQYPFKPYTLKDLDKTNLNDILSKMKKERLTFEPDLRDMLPTLPTWFEEVVKRCMSSESHKRYSNAEELSEVINFYVNPAQARRMVLTAWANPENETIDFDLELRGQRSREMLTVKVNFETIKGLCAQWDKIGNLTFERLERFAEGMTAVDIETEILELLQSISEDGAHFILGPKVRKMLAVQGQSGFWLMHDPRLASIPWEFLKVDNSYLCLRYPMARWPKLLRGKFRNPQFETSEKIKIVIIANPTGDLPGTKSECEQLLEEFSTCPIADRLSIEVVGEHDDSFTIRSKIRRCQILHFAGHAVFSEKGGDMSKSGWLFKGSVSVPKVGDDILRASALEAVLEV